MTCRLFLSATLTALFLSSTTWAEGAPSTQPAGDDVEVHVGAVLASNHGQETDHRLASMRRQFDSFFSYTSYRLVDDQRRKLPWGGKAEFDVPGGRYVMVSPRELKNRHVIMKVVVMDRNHAIIDTTVALRDRGTFLVGGQRQPDGMLILAIGAELVKE